MQAISIPTRGTALLRQVMLCRLNSDRTSLRHPCKLELHANSHEATRVRHTLYFAAPVPAASMKTKNVMPQDPVAVINTMAVEAPPIALQPCVLLELQQQLVCSYLAPHLC